MFLSFSIGPTDPISGNAFDARRRKKGGVGWPKHHIINNALLKTSLKNSRMILFVCRLPVRVQMVFPVRFS